MVASETQSGVVKDLSKAAGDLETRLLFDTSFVLSIMQLALAGAGASFFIGWWALPWFAVLCVLMCMRGKMNTKVPEGAAGAIAICVCSAFYMAACAGAWLIGGVEAGFLAGALLGTQGIYSATFFSSSRLNFFANLGPAIVISAVAPFMIYDNPVPILIVMFGVAQNFTAALLARSNRNRVLEEVLRIQSEMEAARDESIAKSRFIATMSHELRTPLNAVIGYAEILEEELVEDGRTANAEDAVRIRRSACNLLALINDVLDYSKVEAGRLDIHIGCVDVADLIEDARLTVAHLASANNTDIFIEITPEARQARTDPQRLRQCVLNLMSNAAKFTENGEVHVRASIERQDGARLLRIDVSDTGCGIAQADAEQLFKPFSQIDGSLTRKKDGTGLGLMITKRLSELLGGDVDLVSVLGAGSTFSLRVRDHEPDEVESDGEGPLVLVIEDDSAALDLTRRALARLPVRFAEARSAAEGMALAQARKPSLIVLDLHLPDRSGWDLLGELKANETLRDIPVLIASVDDDRARALRLGACEHLVKPVDKERFAAMVLRHAAGAPAQSQALPTVAA